MSCLRAANHYRRKRRTLWVSALVTFALAITFVLGPSTHIAMAMPDAQAAAMHDMGGMDCGEATPMQDCCDGHSGNESGAPCDNSALCMAACGKLPVQAVSIARQFAPVPVISPVAVPEFSFSGQVPSPPHGPPRLG